MIARSDQSALLGSKMSRVRRLLLSLAATSVVMALADLVCYGSSRMDIISLPTRVALHCARVVASRRGPPNHAAPGLYDACYHEVYQRGVAELHFDRR